MKFYKLILKQILFILISILVSKINSSNNFEVYYSMTNEIPTAYQSLNIIESFSPKKKFDCFKECTIDSSCVMIRYQLGHCSLYKKIQYNHLAISSSQIKTHFNKYFPFDSSLINYWPLNSPFVDKKGSSSVISSKDVSFTPDRFNRTDSAVFFNYGHFQVSPGIYFYGADFTISVWVRFDNILPWQRIIDFGNGQQNDNVLLAITSTSNILCHVVNGVNGIPNCHSNLKIIKGVWYHVVCVLRGDKIHVYIDGVFDYSCTSYIPNKIQRQFNYIAKSNWPADYLFLGAIDELQIYNTSLTDHQVSKLFNNYY